MGFWSFFRGPTGFSVAALYSAPEAFFMGGLSAEPLPPGVEYLRQAMLKSLPLLKQEARGDVLGMCSRESLTLLALTLGVGVAVQFTPVGWVGDAVASL